MKVALVLFLLAATRATTTYEKSTSSKESHVHPPHYKHEYVVKDEYYNDYGQSESRYGDQTRGNYWVTLPDGTKHVVDYHVDGKSGFVADVKVDGHGKSYGSQPQYKQEYKTEEYKPTSKTTEYKTEEYKPSTYKKEEYKPTYKTEEYKPTYKKEEYKPSYKREEVNYKSEEYKQSNEEVKYEPLKLSGVLFREDVDSS